MPDGTSLVNLGDLSKPATVLIEKISDAVGGIAKPWQIMRVAKAEAEAALIKADSEIKITELHRRAIGRFITEEAKKQDNIERITGKAIPLLEKSSTPEKMDDDWITNFFDKCRIVSDEEMQSLWSRVLAGEASSPGTYSKRTVDFLGTLDKEEAQLFTNLCGFAWDIGVITPLIFDVTDSVYQENGIFFGSLAHLDDIGLISLQSIGGYKRSQQPKYAVFFYYGEPLVVEFPRPENNELATGKVLFTRTGTQLAPICRSKPVDGFADYVVERLTKQGLVLSSPYPRADTKEH